MICFWDKPSKKTWRNTQAFRFIHLFDEQIPTLQVIGFAILKQPAQVQTSKLSNHGQQVEMFGKQLNRWRVDLAHIYGCFFRGWTIFPSLYDAFMGYTVFSWSVMSLSGKISHFQFIIGFHLWRRSKKIGKNKSRFSPFWYWRICLIYHGL